jgi:putative multiple sugar transport system substrate-binding protein
MKKILTVSLVMAAAAGLLFTGCSKKQAAATPAAGQTQTGAAQAAPAKNAPLIGLAMPETHVERWVKDGNTLKTDFEKMGYRAEVQWGNADQNMQNNQIAAFVTQGAKGLVIGCVNDGVGSAVTDAYKSGCKILAYDRLIMNSSDYDYYLTFNNFKVGVLQGQGLIQGMGADKATADKPLYITLFAGSPTDNNANFFFDGAMSVLNPYIEKGVIKVIGPYPKSSKDTSVFQQIATENWEGPKAKQRMENLLANDARAVTLNGILAPNDTLARAIIEACKADAKYTTKLPIVTGQDAEFDSAKMIKDGEQYCTVFKDTNKEAEAAATLLDQVLRGQEINVPGATLATGDLASIGNTGKKTVKTYLLDPILITKDNLNVPVDAGFYPADQAAQLK